MNLPSTLTRIALTLGLGLAPVLAQQPDKPPAPRPGKAHRGEGMHQRLKLTEAQKKVVEDIRAKHGEAMKAKVQAAQDARKAFHEALAKPDTTPDQLRNLHQTAADAQFEVMLASRELRKEIHAQLTPEQREEAARMDGFRMGRKGGRRGFGGPGFGPHEGFGPGCPAPVCEPAGQAPAK